MQCPNIEDLPSPPAGKKGWPWNEGCPILPPQMDNGVLWPKVSIVTPSYNQGVFLEESIRSVLLQGYPDLEYIIIDAESTDESVQIIKKYETWLTSWVSEPDRGQSHGINKGLMKSTGELFNWHNADDMLAPESLLHAVGAMVQYPEAGYVHGYRIVIDKQGFEQTNTKHSYGNDNCFSPTIQTALSTLKAGTQPGCLMNKALVVELGGIDEELQYVMDVDILLRIALHKAPVYIPYPLVFYRVYPEIQSNQWNKQRAKERLRIVNNIYCDSSLLSATVKQNKKKALSAAHQFAWVCYAKTKNNCCLFFLHFFLDIYYSLGRGWVKRLKSLVNISR